LSRRLKHDGLHPKALSGFDIGRNVIYVKGFLGTGRNGSKGLAIDQRGRFTGSDGTGIDP
jgi:hypothetical protein